MSRRLSRLLTIAAACVTACVLAAPAAGATGSSPSGNSTNAQKCQKGGYAHYLDPSTGKAFTSQDACVSYAAHGGKLQPYLAPPATVDLVMTPPENGFCTVTVSITGASPDATYSGTVSGGDIGPFPVQISTDGTGSGSGSIGTIGWNNRTWTATVDGVTSQPAYCPPPPA